MHAKYFFLNEQRTFGLVIIICIAMFICLTVFLVYHLRLVMENTTTNESFKKHEINQRLDNEKRIILELIRETEEWKAQGSKPEDQKMPQLNIDGKPMPDFRPARLKKLDGYLKS